MSPALDATDPVQRDLRSAQRESKRAKDRDAKWSNGARPSAGCALDAISMDVVGGSESQRDRARPRQKWSETSHHRKQDPNITKLRFRWETHDQRVRSAMNVRDAITDPSLTQSVMGLLPPPSRHDLSLSDNSTYNFDRTESPTRPLSLGIFVKTTNRDTERLVEREYEILDAAGESLHGRKARHDLRKAASAAESRVMENDDDFELV